VPFPKICNFIRIFEIPKNTIFHRDILLVLLFEDRKSAIIKENKRGANGSTKCGMLLAVFPCRAKSSLSLLEVHTEKG
jgi:hypothetical protein